MKYIYLLLFLLLPRMGHAQNETMSSITTEEGLSSSSVQCFFKDSKGYMYIGTMLGVDRFDGTNIVNIPFPVQSQSEKCWVSGIVEENAETLLVSNKMGLWRLDKRGLTMKQVYKDDINFEITCLKRGVNGTIYIGTQGGLLALNNEKIQYVKMFRDGGIRDKRVRDISILHTKGGDVLWIATDRGIVSLNPNTKSGGYYYPYYQAGGKKNIGKIAVSSSGRVFVGTSGDGLLEFDVHHHHYHEYIDVGENVNDLSCDRQGHLLVASGSNGAFEISLAGNMISRRYSSQDIPGVTKLRFDSPYVFYRDDMGVDWIGYLFFGLDYTAYNRRTFHTFTIPGVFDSSTLNVRSFLFDGNRVLLGTRHGLYVVPRSGGNVQTVGRDVLKANVATQLLRTAGSYLVGTIGGGLHILNAVTLSEEHQDVTSQLAGSNVYLMVPDRHGNVWICTSMGLARYDVADNRLKLFTSYNSQLPDNETFCIGFDDNGTGWISTRGGICLYIPETQSISVQGIPRRIADMNLLLSITNYGHQCLLINPQHGFPVVYNTVSGQTQMMTLNIEYRMPAVLYFKKLGYGQYLFCTEDGLFFEDKSGFRRFGYIDGLSNLQFQSHSIFVDSQRQFWAATNGGLVYARCSDMMKNRYKHIPIILTEIQTDHWYTDAETNGVVFDGKLRLSRYNSEMSLRFSPLLYGNTKGIVFRYKLEGYDDKWRVARYDRTLFYHSLPAGDYKLHIEAMGMPEISTVIAVSVPYTYNAIFWFFILLLAASLLVHIIYCRHYNKEYIWKRFIPKPVKYQNSRMDTAEVKALSKRLREYMEDKKPYMNAGVQMADIAKSIGCSGHELSQLFTQFMHRNYYDYIAEYRVEEFKRMAADPAYARYTISTLYELCGFRSRSSFVASFKKFTGMMPKDYIKKSRKP